MLPIADVVFQEEPCTALLCGHVFHEMCLEKYSEAQGGVPYLNLPCPNCRHVSVEPRADMLGIAGDEDTVLEVLLTQRCRGATLFESGGPLHNNGLLANASCDISHRHRS